MDVLTLTETTIVFWEGVRDVAALEANLEASYGVNVDSYIVKGQKLVMDFNYTGFEFNAETNQIFFTETEETLAEEEDEIGWPEMTDEQLYELYSFGEVEQILKAKSKYTLLQCKAYERQLNTEFSDNPPELVASGDLDEIPPEDFPDLPRKLITVLLPSSTPVVVKKVKVEKYAG